MYFEQKSYCHSISYQYPRLLLTLDQYRSLWYSYIPVLSSSMISL